MKTIEELNKIAAENLKSLPELVEAVLVYDHDFFRSGLNRYTLIAVAEKDVQDYDVPEYCTIIPQEAFEQIIKTPDDVVPHYFHVMGHARCMEFWRRISFPRQMLRENELSYFEEIYNIHLFRKVAPTIVKPFVDYGQIIEGYRKFANPELRKVINAAFSYDGETLFPSDFPPHVENLVKALFDTDAFNLRTFEGFMRAAHDVLNSKGFAPILEACDKIAA